MSWKTITHKGKDIPEKHDHTGGPLTEAEKAEMDKLKKEDQAASGRRGSTYSSRIDKDCECGGELDTFVDDRGETRELHCLDCGARYEAIFTGDGVSSSWARGKRLSQ